MVRKLGPGSVVLLGLLLSLGSECLAAQQSVPTYGVDSPLIAVVSAWDMEGVGSSTTWDVTGFYRYSTNGGQLIAAIHVPSGARLLSLELDACDTTATALAVGQLFRVDAGSGNALAVVSTDTAATPGCGRFSADLIAGPETVDNYQFQYVVTAQNNSFDQTTLIGAIRVVYELQVSPAPAIATFNDVPTSDPGFQYIEALAASGITAGCGGGNYCPDATLTRRQMAVFLSKALGLHWNEVPIN